MAVLENILQSGPQIIEKAGRLVVEDLDSLSGTFVNDLRVERATLHDGDWIWIEKHHIKVDSIGVAAIPWDAARKSVAPKINETMVLDTKARRDMLQQAAAIGERSQFSLGRLKMPTLVVLGGRLDQKEYVLINKLTVIGKSAMATVPPAGLVQTEDGGADQPVERRLLSGNRRKGAVGKRLANSWTDPAE